MTDVFNIVEPLPGLPPTQGQGLGQIQGQQPATYLPGLIPISAPGSYAPGPSGSVSYASPTPSSSGSPISPSSGTSSYQPPQQPYQSLQQPQQPYQSLQQQSSYQQPQQPYQSLQPQSSYQQPQQSSQPMTISTMTYTPPPSASPLLPQQSYQSPQQSFILPPQQPPQFPQQISPTMPYTPLSSPQSPPSLPSQQLSSQSSQQTFTQPSQQTFTQPSQPMTYTRPPSPSRQQMPLRQPSPPRQPYAQSSQSVQPAPPVPTFASPGSHMSQESNIPAFSSSSSSSPSQAGGGSSVPRPSATRFVPPPVTPRASITQNRMSNVENLNYEDVINKANFEELLLTMGYAILEKIIVNTSDRGPVVRYLKAVNKNGQTLYIDINIEGYVSSEGASTLLEETNVTAVPYSTKISAIQCSKLDICGVAFNCENGVCMVRRGDDMKPQEQNLIRTVNKNPGGISGIADVEKMIPYPMILLSEIFSQPDAMLQAVAEYTKTSLNDAYQTMHNQLPAMIDSINRLMQVAQNIASVEPRISADLKQALDQMNSIDMLWMQNPPKDARQRANFEKFKYNLRLKNDQASDFVSIYNKVLEQRIVIDDVRANLDNLFILIKQKLSNILAAQ